MLFTPTPPGQGSVGEVYLQEVVSAFPQAEICCFAPWSTRYAVWKPDPKISWLDMEIVDLPNERLVGRQRGVVLDRVYSFLYRHQHWAQLDPIVDRAVEFGKQQKVDVVLAVLASPSIIRMAAQVAR